MNSTQDMQSRMWPMMQHARSEPQVCDLLNRCAVYFLSAALSSRALLTLRGTPVDPTPQDSLLLALSTVTKSNTLYLRIISPLSHPIHLPAHMSRRNPLVLILMHRFLATGLSPMASRAFPRSVQSMKSSIPPSSLQQSDRTRACIVNPPTAMPLPIPLLACRLLH